MTASLTDLGDVLGAIDRRPWLARLAGFCLGTLMSLGLAPARLPLITVLALALALRLQAKAPDRRCGALLGWFLGFGYFLTALQWIVEPFFVDAAHDAWMAPFALALLPGGLALFWGAAFWIAWGHGRPDGPRRGMAAVLALSLAEMLRSQVFTGFPWALIGSVWVDHPLSQLAALGGVHGLTFLTGVLAVGVLTLSVWQASRRALLAAGITVLAWGGGTFLGERILGAYVTGQAGRAPGPVIRVVQPDEPQDQKWLPEMLPVFWQRKLDLMAAPATVRPAVIVLPEVALPYLLEQGTEGNAWLAEAAGGAVVLAGVQRFQGMDLRNSLAVIEPDGGVAQVYDKHHLVPFGEYIPGGALARALGLNGLATDYLGGFTPGPGPAVLDLGRYGRVLPLICYEAIFPRHAHSSAAERPRWIVQVTNDAWFGSFSGPQQHLDQARLRAIEQGLPLVRSANTGISAIIDAKGRVLGSLPLNTFGAIDRPLPPAANRTLFAAAGNLPLLLMMAGISLWLFGTRR